MPTKTTLTGTRSANRVIPPGFSPRQRPPPWTARRGAAPRAATATSIARARRLRGRRAMARLTGAVKTHEKAHGRAPLRERACTGHARHAPAVPTSAIGLVQGLSDMRRADGSPQGWLTAGCCERGLAPRGHRSRRARHRWPAPRSERGGQVVDGTGGDHTDIGLHHHRTGPIPASSELSFREPSVREAPAWSYSPLSGPRVGGPHSRVRGWGMA